ncbi:MAG TPA: hypothetical protein VIO61_13140 [Anaerolineaceae bacterium]
MATGGRRRGPIIIIIALLLIVCVVGAYFAITKLNLGGAVAPQTAKPAVTAPAPVEEMVEIAITSQQIGRGGQFTPDVVTTVPYPKKDIGENSPFILKKDIETNLYGKRVKYDVDAHVPITKSMVDDNKASGSEASFQIPRGKVAISIPLSRMSAVSYALHSGDHIDLIASMLIVDLDASFQSQVPNLVDLNVLNALLGPAAPTTGSPTETPKPQTSPIPQFLQGRAEIDQGSGKPIYVIPSEKQRPRLVSQTVIQDAIVLFVGDYSAPVTKPAGPTPTPNPQATPAPPPPPPDVITLVVDPQEAVSLNYLMLSGAKLNMVMRAAGDIGRIKIEAVTQQYILDQYSIPIPAKLPYGFEPRINDLSTPIKPFPDVAP